MAGRTIIAKRKGPLTRVFAGPRPCPWNGPERTSFEVFRGPGGPPEASGRALPELATKGRERCPGRQQQRRLSANEAVAVAGGIGLGRTCGSWPGSTGAPDDGRELPDEAGHPPARGGLSARRPSGGSGPVPGWVGAGAVERGMDVRIGSGSVAGRLGGDAAAAGWTETESA